MGKILIGRLIARLGGHYISESKGRNDVLEMKNSIGNPRIEAVEFYGGIPNPNEYYDQ